MTLKNKIKSLPLTGKTFVKIGSLLRNSREQLNSWLFFLKKEDVLKKNTLLHNKYNGKRCFILACGPSINMQDLTVISEEYSMSINSFFLHPNIKQINPTWHIFPPTHDPITDKNAIAWFKKAEEAFPKEQKVFASLTDQYLIEPNNFFKNRDLHFYFLGKKDLAPYKNIRLDQPLPQTATNVVTAMLIAVILGFKKIYLLGVDHDWLLHQNRTQHHFYHQEDDPLWEDIQQVVTSKKDLEIEFAAHIRTWRIHKNMKKIAKQYGAEIINLSPGSMLDVYPKEKLENVIKSPN